MANNTRRRGMHPAVAFILGFLLALLILGGTIAGVTLYFLNYKIDKISGNKDGDGNYVYINGDKASGGADTVLGLLKRIGELSKDFPSCTVEDVEQLLPVVATLVDKLETALSEYVALEENELQRVKFGELGSFVSGLKDRIDVARMAEVRPDNAIMCYLGYGLTKVAYDDAEGLYRAKYKDEDGAVHDCIVEVDVGGKVTGAHYTDGDGQTEVTHLTLGNVSRRIDGVTNELTIGDVVDIADDDRLLGSVKNSTINSLSEDIGKLSVQQLFVDEIYCVDSSDTAAEGEEAYKAPIYEVFAPATPLTTASGWQKDVIYYVENADGTYSLAGSCGKLKDTGYDDKGNLITNCYDPAQTYYTLGEGKILYDPAFVYYRQNEDGSYAMLNTGEENAGRLSSFEPDRYAYGSPSALWKLLLYGETDESTESNKIKEEKVYAVNNIGVMINNVSKNTQNTSMRELDAAGILTFGNKADLDKHVKWTDADGSHDKILGEMELTEVVGVFVLFADLINLGT